MTKFGVRGGNSGFVKNGVVWGSDPGSCPRRILLRHHGIEEQPDEKSKKVFAIGHLNEELFEQELKQKKLAYDKELALCEPIFDDVDFHGHSDYVVTHPDIGKCVYELKSVTSKNTYKKIFEQSDPKLSNLAQCVNYMLSVETTRGRLRYSSFIEAIEYKDIDLYNIQDILDTCREIIPEHKVFEIEIHPSGSITVDGEINDFSVTDILDHRRLSAEMLRKNTVFSDRPQPSELFNNVCGFCPFREVCEGWDGSRTTEQFLEQCKSALTKEKHK